jgi:hypothetical protein
MSVINPLVIRRCGPDTYTLPASGFTQSGPFELELNKYCNYSGRGPYGQCYTWSPNYQHYAWEGTMTWDGTRWHGTYVEQCWAYTEDSLNTGGEDPYKPSCSMFNVS